MDKTHDRVPQTPTPASADGFGKGAEKGKAQPRCSSPLPVDRNMPRSGGKSDNDGDERY